METSDQPAAPAPARRAFKTLVTVVIVVAVLVGVLAFLMASTANVRPSARRIQCRQNLKQLYAALVKYAELHGEMPRGRDGKPSIDPLFDPETQRQLGIDDSTLSCPSVVDPVGRSYYLNPSLSADDLEGDPLTIIACDQNPVHSVSGAGAYWDAETGGTLVLLGNGAVVLMDLPPEDQDAWRRLFLAGDERAGVVTTDTAAADDWHRSELKWYVGSEKQYASERP